MVLQNCYISHDLKNYFCSTETFRGSNNKNKNFPFYLFLTLLFVPCLFDVKMRAAAVAWEAGKPLSIETIEVAPPQKGEVRLRILFNSLCRSDVYWWDAKVY